MEKKYKVLDDYVVREEDHSPSFSTKEEATDYAVKNIRDFNYNNKYVVKVETCVSKVMPVLETKIEEL